jgi:hypothetical protein
MKEITGDLWIVVCDARCITTNGTITGALHRGVMGRGVAKQAKDRYPGIEAILGQRLQQHGNHTQLLAEPADGVPLVALPVKRHWMDKADFELIKRSLEELVVLTEARGWQTVLLPRPGCGNGRQLWEDVEKICRPRLDDRFTVVYRGTGRQWEA